MDLYILRHAIAEERDATKYPDDALRPLTQKGMKRMRRVAEGMLSIGVAFDVIYTSPFIRARQTADIVAEVFGTKNKFRETETLAVDGDPKRLVDLLNSAKGEFESILLVGHEPYLSEFISTLLTRDENLLVNMKKGGMCKLNVQTLKYGKCASLEWLLPPSISTHLE